MASNVTLSSDHVLALSLGEPWGQALAIAHAREEVADRPALSHYDRALDRFLDGPLEGKRLIDCAMSLSFGSPSPMLLDAQHEPISDDSLAIARTLAPSLFPEGTGQLVSEMQWLLGAVYELGQLTDQAEYEAQHARLGRAVEAWNARLANARFLGPEEPRFADVLLFTFCVRLDPVYFELCKASIGLLADFPALEGHARDLYELPEYFSTTDFTAIQSHHYLFDPVNNPRRIIPRGGRPDLDAPHFRSEQFGGRRESGVEEDPGKRSASGEWVRPRSRGRSWISQRQGAQYPPQTGRYHLYAPYNCPWSHRALLGRAVLGLESAIGASIVYFRRDPEHGWQFNPRIPGCTPDRVHGKRYVAELYQIVSSAERSVPVLWDTATNTLVSNESADILRMFATECRGLAKRDLDLYPETYADEIDRLNAMIYHRINNGAYKAGFARSQLAYDRAFARYFRALDWLEDLLKTRDWLAGTEAPSEADLRLFPTLFRHDAVYYARFKLNLRRVVDYPRLRHWLDRMLERPGVAAASNLDHARNGYFGRTGNEIVPAGPVPLGLSPKDFTRDEWLNR